MVAVVLSGRMCLANSPAPMDSLDETLLLELPRSASVMVLLHQPQDLMCTALHASTEAIPLTVNAPWREVEHAMER